MTKKLSSLSGVIALVIVTSACNSSSISPVDPSSYLFPARIDKIEMRTGSWCTGCPPMVQIFPGSDGRFVLDPSKAQEILVFLIHPDTPNRNIRGQISFNFSTIPCLVNIMELNERPIQCAFIMARRVNEPQIRIELEETGEGLAQPNVLQATVEITFL